MPSRAPQDRSPRSTTGAPVPFGKWVLDKRIAMGGMSEVYLAHAAEAGPAGERVVIKRLLPDLRHEANARRAFAAEGALHAAAVHPNIVRVHETGEVDGEPFLAMEYVPGVDLHRVMRRAQAERRPVPFSVSIYLARELCKALTSVHAMQDERGQSLGVVHRDVTPSNIYLSTSGDVKLGDFGIARTSLAQARPPGSGRIKGKYAYLSPEQVTGEGFDHRADLFSLTVVLAELLIGGPLFPGAGQLAVLLAIRDCRIDPLRAIAHTLPPGLMGLLERSLARAPEHRFASADALAAALAPYEARRSGDARTELAQWVAWTSDATELVQRMESALRESSAGLRPSSPSYSSSPISQRAQTVAPQPMLASVRTSAGRSLRNVPFAKLVELIVTGQLVGEDEVDMMGAGYRRLDDIELLARHLPSATGTTTQIAGPGVPDYVAELAVTPMSEVLAWLLGRLETGVLFVDRSDEGRGARKELYFEKGKLVLAASSEASELLGEYLLRRGALDRAELDMALLMMPKFEGRLGDTLIGLGLLDAVDLFRAIRAQGRDRVADVFTWKDGRVTFYRDVTAARIDFRLDLELPALMLAGLERSLPEAAALARLEEHGAVRLAPVRPAPASAKAVAWPPPVLHALHAVGAGATYGAVAGFLATSRGIAMADAVRAIEVALASGLLVVE